MNGKTNTTRANRTKRRARIRARVSGTAERPRLSVYRSNRALYAQLIDDANAHTLAAADTRTLAGDTLTERATALGAEIAKQAKAAKITSVVFDRSGYRYHGTIAAIAEAAREGGLEF